LHAARLISSPSLRCEPLFSHVHRQTSGDASIVPPEHRNVRYPVTGDKRSGGGGRQRHVGQSRQNRAGCRRRSTYAAAWAGKGRCQWQTALRQRAVRRTRGSKNEYARCRQAVMQRGTMRRASQRCRKFSGSAPRYMARWRQAAVNRCKPGKSRVYYGSSCDDHNQFARRNCPRYAYYPIHANVASKRETRSGVVAATE